MFKSTFLILIAFILAACASSGSKFNMADVDAMRPGQTTIEEAKAKLGPPQSEVFAAGGGVGLVWVYFHASPFGGESRSVGILFDKDRKMIRVTTKSGQQTR